MAWLPSPLQRNHVEGRDESVAQRLTWRGWLTLVENFVRFDAALGAHFPTLQRPNENRGLSRLCNLVDVNRAGNERMSEPADLIRYYPPARRRPQRQSVHRRGVDPAYIVNALGDRASRGR